MTLRKYAHGRVLDEEATAIDKTADQKQDPKWTAEDAAALRDENQK